MINFLNYLLIANIFLGSFLIFSKPFDFNLGYILVIYFLIVYVIGKMKFPVNSKFFIILAGLSLFSLLNIAFGNTSLFLMAKPLTGIFLTGSAYYLLFKINDYNIDKLFKIYLLFALFVSVIGIIQEISYFFGFKYGYDFSAIIPRWGVVPNETLKLLRINSVFTEPSHFAITIAPAFFVALSNFFRKTPTYFYTRLSSAIILIAYLLTFSAIGYMAILVSLIIIFLNSPKLRYLIFLLPILLYVTYFHVPDIRMRVNDSVSAIISPSETSKIHLSTYALLTNAYVAYKSFLDSPLFGRGLGSHPVSYDKFIHPGVSGVIWYKDYPEANKMDAGSLLLRLLSETGLLGILGMLFFLLKCRVTSNDCENLKIICNSALILFLLYLMRQGHYFFNGLLFFVWLYYFTYKNQSKPVIHTGHKSF